jgi:hypothetical protein
MAGNNYEDQLAQQNGAFEPQRQFQWILKVGLDDNSAEGMLELAIKSMFPPSDSNEPIEIPYMNSRVWVAGKHMVEAGTINFFDYVDKNTAKIIRDWRLKVYDPDTGKMGYAKDYKKAATLYAMPPDMNESNARKYELQGMFPFAAKFGTFDYSANALVEIEVQFRFDKFRLK